MAKCPECGITVAFHERAEMDCWNCNAPLVAEVTRDAADFRRTIAHLKEGGVRRLRTKVEASGEQCPGGKGCECCHAGCDCGCRNDCPKFQALVANS
jgi:hypothetical protein